jgi:hypothetical protein
MRRTFLSSSERPSRALRDGVCPSSRGGASLLPRGFRLAITNRAMERAETQVVLGDKKRASTVVGEPWQFTRNS